jgi:hypothetical protein
MERTKERSRRQDAEDPLKSLERQANLLLKASLLGTGIFHQHARGQWRRKREHCNHQSIEHPAPGSCAAGSMR